MVHVVRNSSQDWKNEKKKKTDEILRHLDGASREQEAAKRAEASGLPYMDLHIFPTDTPTATLLPESDAKRLGIAAFDKTGNTVRIGFADPENPEATAFTEKLGSDHRWEIERYVVSKESLEKAWSAYGKIPLIKNLDLLHISLSGEDLKDFEKNFSDLLRLKDESSVTTTKTIEIILAGANKLRASDVHIEPEENAVRLRYRIDGALQDIGDIPKDTYRLALSRVKMLAKMKVNVRDRSQDGHFGMEIDGKKVDLRVNIIPGNYGESINLRILDSESILFDLETVGLNGETLEKVTRSSEKPHGMILNTGPTGSGKTTTLYSLLHSVNKPEVKIITIEDPIEYRLPGIVQTEISKDGSYTFAAALRAVVRQDPDIILVGEIRDEETAEIAVNAASTGHLLLSTVHANSAAGAVSRLIELGVKPSLITAATNIIIGQRLVRTLCEDCKSSYAPAKETIDSIGRILSVISPKAKVRIPHDIAELWKPVGCPKCNFTGYKGRIGIFEAFTMTEPIEKLVLELGTEREIMRAAIEDGMVTMLQDGILKALEGRTTLEEVWRATGQKESVQELYEELMSSPLSRTSVIPESILSGAEKNLSSFEAFAKYVEGLDDDDIVRAVFAAALLLRAGDVHIEPADDAVLVRFRIDGILQTALTLSRNTYPAVLGKIKLWSGLKTERRAGVTDGRFSLSIPEAVGTVDAGTVDIRLSLILGGFGETAVMRILGNSSGIRPVDELGFRKENLERIRIALRKPGGMIVNVGPTGSGKTTTLYGLLSRLNIPEVKIITVEDPIEYRLKGILQTQVNESEGYSFSEALRALLRQNPDIVMIGEMRDEETADIAVQAAVTGHLVLSTIHAESAAGAVSRLLGMGIRPEDLANATDCFISQRLVRKLCPHCRKKDSPTEEESEMIRRVLGRLPEGTLEETPETDRVFRAVGCPECNGVGYSGQIVLSEVLLKNRKIESLISENALTSEIDSAAVESGMIPLPADGVLAALEGMTTLEEVRRVTDE